MSSRDRNARTKEPSWRNPPVGNGKGKVPGVAGGQGKNRLDEGGVGLYIGHGHQDIPGPERWVPDQQIQQDILQDLDLPHGAVGHVDLQGVIPRVQSGPLFPPAGPQIQYVALKLGQQGSRRWFLKILALLRILVQQQVQKFPTHLPPGRQERIPGFPPPAQRLVPSALNLAPGEEIPPIFPAGIEQEQTDRAMPGQQGQDLDVKRRQRRNPEDADPLRQRAQRLGRPPGRLPQVPQQGRPVPARIRCHEGPPEPGLPMILPAFFPIQDHFRPEKQILVVEKGQAFRQLETFQMIPVLGKITGQIVKGRIRQTAGEQIHDPPGEALGFKERGLPAFARESGKNVTYKMIRKGKRDIGAHAQAPGQLQGDPPLHAPALDQDNLRLQRARQRVGEDLGQSIGKAFQAVTGIEDQGHVSFVPAGLFQPAERFMLRGGQTLEDFRDRGGLFRVGNFPQR